jgi:hypothetical protein
VFSSPVDPYNDILDHGGFTVAGKSSSTIAQVDPVTFDVDFSNDPIPDPSTGQAWLMRNSGQGTDYLKRPPGPIDPAGDNSGLVS